MIDTFQEALPIEAQIVFDGPDRLNQVADHFLAADAAAALADETAPFQYRSGLGQPGYVQGNGDRIGIGTIAKGDLLDFIIGVDDAFAQTETGHVGNFVAGSPHDDSIRLSLYPYR
jgi:hypothetical protein